MVDTGSTCISFGATICGLYIAGSHPRGTAMIFAWRRCSIAIRPFLNCSWLFGNPESCAIFSSVRRNGYPTLHQSVVSSRCSSANIFFLPHFVVRRSIYLFCCCYDDNLRMRLTVLNYRCYRRSKAGKGTTHLHLVYRPRFHRVLTKLVEKWI